MGTPWTDGRYAEDDTQNWTTSWRWHWPRATVLKVTQTEPSRGFVAWQALVDGALQPIVKTPKRCKDAKELKQRLTAWSLMVAEYEHQFKVNDVAQKFVVREMMPKDIKCEFLTGPRKLDEIMGKLEIVINEMMADDGPTPMDLGNVSGCDTKTTQGDSDASDDMSYADVCVIACKGYKAGKGMGQDHGIVEKGLMNWRLAGEMTEARKEARRAPRAASLMGTVTGTREAMGAKGKARAKVRASAKPDTATTVASKGISG